jgi:16S rRNA (cytosine1402-N4)-methyltransferase
MNHIPVLKEAVLDLMEPSAGEMVIDVTLGLGGHAKAFLEKIGAKGKLVGVDADEENLREVEKVVKVGKVDNVTLIHGNFRDLTNFIYLQNLQTFDVLFADLGLSSPHIDDPNKGFSFREDGPLDCRYDRSQGLNATQFIEQSSDEELSDILKKYGELKKAYPLSRAIKEVKPKTTFELVKAVESVYKWESKKIAPQVFQALRIAVNDEIGALEALLASGPGLLKSGGRMGIISYHSLEDRLVKQRFKSLSSPIKDSVTGSPLAPASYELLTKKAIQATLTEVENNPRARSAKLRAIRKVPN